MTIMRKVEDCLARRWSDCYETSGAPGGYDNHGKYRKDAKSYNNSIRQNNSIRIEELLSRIFDLYPDPQRCGDCGESH